MSKKTNVGVKVTYGDENLKDLFPKYNTERERIKAMSLKYKRRSIVDAFNDYYNVDITVGKDKESSRSINRVTILEPGGIYIGTVKSIDSNGIVFDIPGVKEEIRCKENFNDCIDSIQNYLMTHNNSLYFEVRDVKKDKITVSVINGYYKKWVEKIENVKHTGDALKVHIDDLVRGGYICHCNIGELCDLTGKSYTSSVFIPGSQIVLNIENDFEKWIGEDVLVIPKNFVDFRTAEVNGEYYTEKSLIGSRKEVLQILGNQNLLNMWNVYALSKKDNVTYTPETMSGVVTGIINSNKKQGVFIELDNKYITGFLSTSKFLDYKQGDTIYVKVKEFEVQEGKQPFELTKSGVIKKCNVRLVFDEA